MKCKKYDKQKNRQKCKPNKDFGRGFYVAKLRSQAEDKEAILRNQRADYGI